VRDVLDPFVCLDAIAAATSRLVVVPMATQLVRRRPAALARQALTLERLSQVVSSSLAERWPNHRTIRRSARFEGVAILRFPGARRGHLAAGGADGGGPTSSRSTSWCCARPAMTQGLWRQAGVTWLMTLIGPFGIVADEAVELAHRGPQP
jgi:Luciferase-like monooxygenase